MLWFLIGFISSMSFVSALPVDNGVEGTPEVICGESFVEIKWRTRNPFEGEVFVRGHYGESECRSGPQTAEQVTGEKEARIKLPFASRGLKRQRSTDPRGVFVSTTVVLSFHQRLITKADRIYMVQCFYMEAVKTVTAELEVSMLTTSLQTQTVPMPLCRYEVLDGGPNGQPVKFAKIGDPVYHKWTCDTDTVDTFCMLIHSCTVDDGAGTNVPLLDVNGCAQDKYLLGNLEYIGDLMAGRESHVFKYADKSSLYFNCQVTIGVREPGQICPKPQCPEPTRGKRSKDGIPVLEIENSTMARDFSAKNVSIDEDPISAEVIDVQPDPFTIVDLEPRAKPDAATTSQQPNNDRQDSRTPKPKTNRIKKRRADDVCLSMLGFSSYAAVNAAMALTSISLFVAAYRRSSK